MIRDYECEYCGHEEESASALQPVCPTCLVDLKQVILRPPAGIVRQPTPARVGRGRGR